MDERRRNHANYFSDEEPVLDSEDDVVHVDAEENAVAIDSDDDIRLDNPQAAAYPNILNLDHEIIDAVTDSEDSHNDSNYSDDNDVDDFTDHSVTDSEDDLEANESDEEIVSDSDDDPDNQNPAYDPDDDVDNDDDVGEFINQLQETFNLNAEVEGFNEPLLAAGNGNLQILEKFVLIVAKALRFKESYKSMITAFKIANMGFDNANFPNNMRDFWRVVNRRNADFVNVIVCTICWQELGRGKKPQINCQCGQCGPERKNSELGSYLYINLHSQIRGLLNKPGIDVDLQYPYTRRKHNVEAIEDVYDGAEYRRLSAEGQFLWRENHNYSLAIWTDGVSPVKTANIGIWPVFVQVLELSPRARQRNSILAAVYVGPRKPQMAQFLTPVAVELRNIHANGVTWRPNGNEEIVSRFMTLIVSADSEARYLIFGMTRHNGDHGCTFCYANGERNVHNRRQPPIYRRNDGNAADRTDAEIRQDAQWVNENNVPRRGVKAVSAMSIIPGFNLRTGQLVEPMHCLWEGNFVRLFNNLTNPHVENHIAPRDLSTISDRITSIRTPTKLSRLPRDLTRFANFTATEYRNTAWFYWLPCAEEFLEPSYLRLSAIFAEATFILNKDSILQHELDRAEELLEEYRRDFENYFQQEELVYNVHLLKHIVRCVRDLGPLWVASGFWFESLNRQVVNYLTSPTDRAWQVACRMLLGQMIEKFMDWPLSPAVEELLRDLIGKEKWDEAPNVATGRYLLNDGVINRRLIEAQEIIALTEAGFDDIDPELLMVVRKKICIDGVKYQSPNVRVTKFNNSIAHVNAEYRGEELKFVSILSIVTWQHNGRERHGIFGNRFRIIGPAFHTTYMDIVEKTQDLVYVRLRNVITPAVLVQSCEKTYISRLPNRWDND